MLFAHPLQATNSAARAEICLQATSMHAYFQPARACGRSKNLGNSKKLVRPWPEQPDWLRRSESYMYVIPEAEVFDFRAFLSLQPIPLSTGENSMSKDRSRLK